MDNIHPVGSIYITINDTNPSTYFGGTWERLSGGFIYASTATSGTKGESGNGTGVNTGASSGNTGSTALTINQIPAHNHPLQFALNNGTKTTYHYCGVGYSNQTQIFYQDGVPAQSGEVPWGVGNRGGSQGHTHSLNSHIHTIPYIAVYIWKRVS